jgi:putative metalloprotease
MLAWDVVGLGLVCFLYLRYGLFMKVLVWIILSLFLLTGCEDTNLDLATEAGVDAVRAITLSDSQVRLLAREAAGLSDRKHRVAGPGNVYQRRLEHLVGKLDPVGEMEFNYKAYISPQVNAFAMADGSIRIYSGLMDRMDDRELLFVIGHEMGHVVENHVKKKIMVAYAASALRKGIASQENAAGLIASSALGGFVEALANAQFSQQEEQAADDFGLWFLKQNKFPDQAAVAVAARALEKLAASSKNHSLLSSHPRPDQRADRIRSSMDPKEISLTDRLMEKAESWYSLIKNKIMGKERPAQ